MSRSSDENRVRFRSVQFLDSSFVIDKESPHQPWIMINLGCGGEQEQIGLTLDDARKLIRGLVRSLCSNGDPVARYLWSRWLVSEKGDDDDSPTRWWERLAKDAQTHTAKNYVELPLASLNINTENWFDVRHTEVGVSLSFCSMDDNSRATIIINDRGRIISSNQGPLIPDEDEIDEK